MNEKTRTIYLQYTPEAYPMQIQTQELQILNLNKQLREVMAELKKIGDEADKISPAAFATYQNTDAWNKQRTQQNFLLDEIRRTEAIRDRLTREFDTAKAYIVAGRHVTTLELERKYKEQAERETSR